MSEYTPTTEEVEDSYQWGVNACGCCATRDEADVKAFQRWLAVVRRQAAQEALLQAADAFEVGGINIEVFGDSVEARLWQMSNQTRASLVKSLRARAEAYRREGVER